MSKKEDLKFRQKFNSKKEGSLLNMATGAEYGAKSAWNFFNLQYRDQLNKMNQSNLYLLNGDYRSENIEKSIEEKEKEMIPYRNAELENLREYQAFYENIDNAPARFLTSLSYGVTRTNLNPIEFAKNTALNTVSFGANKFINLGAHILIDTTDNFLTFRYEDELLGLIKKNNAETFIQAGGGAIIGNLIFPAIRWGGRKIKGAMGIDDILEESISNINAKDLKNIDILDFDDPDPKVTFKNKKYSTEVKKVPDDPTFGVNIKHEIKATNDLLETGHDSTSAINFREMADEIIELGHSITREAVKNKNKVEKRLLKQGKSIIEASKNAPMERTKTNIQTERNVMGMINNYIEKPISLYENIYKTDYHKAIRKISNKYDDAVLNIGPFKRNVNERLSEDLADNIVVDTVLGSVFDTTIKFSAKENTGIDEIKLSEFGTKIVKEWREAIGLAVTHNTKENFELFKNTPKYNEYFFDGKEQKIFDTKIDRAITDFLKEDLSVEEISKILFYQKNNYEFFKETNNLKETFESYIVKKINDNIGKNKSLYKQRIKELFKKGQFNVENVKKNLDKIKEKKINTAIISLSFNKEQIFDFFIKNTDSETGNLKVNDIKDILGEKVFLLNRLDGETQEQALKRFITDLRTTTNWKKEISQDIGGIDFNETVSRDLIDVIKDNFSGRTTKQKMKNFADFMEFWKNDNISMLNLMEEMTTTEKASLTALGIPFYRMKNIVNDEEGLLKFFYDIPVLRKDYNKIVKGIASDRAIAVEVQEAFKKALGNYIKRKDMFKKSLQSDPIDMLTDSVSWGVRNYFLAFSGIKEIPSHPLLTALKGSEYFDGNFFKSLYEVGKTTPRALGLTMLRELKPLAGMSVGLNKLYRGLEAIIGGDDGELLASLEIARMANIITPRKNGNIAVEGIKGMASIVQDFNLHLQGSMQNLRFVSSNLLAIQKIKSLLTYDKFESLSIEDQKRFKMVYIDDDIKFQKWKETLNLQDKDNNIIGLRKALYETGFSDETKYLKSSMAYDLYAEDPLKNTREFTKNKELLSKFRTLFTTFTNDLFNYGLDKTRYYKDKKGIYRSRLSIAYLKHLKENPINSTLALSGGIAGITLLSIGGMAGQYIDSKVFGKSDDEKIKAKLKAIAYSGDKNKYIRNLSLESTLAGTGLDAFTYSPNSITDMFRTMWENKFIPKRVSTLYNSIQGTPIYSKAYNMDWYTKALYDKEIQSDVRKRAGLGKEEKQTLEEFFKAMDTAYTEVLEENNKLPKGSGIERRRELLGYNDKKEVKEIKESKNYQSLEAITLIQSNPNNVKNNFINNLSEAEENDLLNKDTSAYLEAIGYTKEADKLIKKEVKLTKEEEKELKKYMDSLDEKDEFWRMMHEISYKSYLLDKR
ncbi:MAG: hypothetical protein SOR11_10755 [Fusobacterium sp.]|uniref:hypothetical protein n=1 Tax=Fusobacterium sp. TaxID=68766 RepID=UPI002A75D4C9|nr:hypothetical protein [Fusobacterium sp.]MDY3060452.1 hypothetical protein [Fusobacterium sp.]